MKHPSPTPPLLLLLSLPFLPRFLPVTPNMKRLAFQTQPLIRRQRRIVPSGQEYGAPGDGARAHGYRAQGEGSVLAGVVELFLGGPGEEVGGCGVGWVVCWGVGAGVGGVGGGGLHCWVGCGGVGG